VTIIIALAVIALVASVVLKGAPRYSLREFWAATVMIWCAFSIPIIAVTYV
jgi:hypothetical protein